MNSDHGPGEVRLGRLRLWYPVVDSTMAIAAGLARIGAPHGTVIQADVQTAGRGRQGRAWVTTPGSALLTSWILRMPFPPGDIGALSPLIALGVVRAIRSLAPEAPVTLKWPNDVLIDDRKVAGILLASHGSGGERVVIAGIGLNLLTEAIPDGVAGAALAGWTADADADRLLDLLAVHLDDVLQSFLRSGTIDNAVRDEIDASLAWRGEPVTLITGTGSLEGVACGIDQDGSLLLHMSREGAVTSIRVGEIARGPRRV